MKKGLCEIAEGEYIFNKLGDCVNIVKCIIIYFENACEVEEEGWKMRENKNENKILNVDGIYIEREWG